MVSASAGAQKIKTITAKAANNGLASVERAAAAWAFVICQVRLRSSLKSICQKISVTAAFNTQRPP
jgi:hypothetical protein